MWNTLTTANTFFTTVYGSEWASLTDPDKTALLATANSILSTDRDYSFPDVPEDRMLSAECLLAYNIFEGKHEDSNAGVKRLRTGGYEVEYRDNYRPTYNSHILNLLSIYRNRITGRITRE